MMPSRKEKIFEIHRDKRIIFLTKNLAPGKVVYGEKVLVEDAEEYRFWEPKSSKLCAALHKGLKNIFLKQGDAVLYLGASTGTTVSHVSDIIGNEGLVFAVEISPTTCRELVFLAEDRVNIAPILADANKPELYLSKISKVDWLYQDIAQKNQTEIFLKNSKLFLKDQGYAILALKARSINFAKEPQKIFEETKQQLQKEFEIIDEIKLEPFQKDHCLFVCRKK